MLINSACICLSLGYVIGYFGSSNPRLERLAAERAKNQTKKGRETRLNNEKEDIKLRKRITIDAANNYLNDPNSKPTSMSGVAMQIHPLVDQECQAAGIESRKVGMILNYLNENEHIIRLLEKRKQD